MTERTFLADSALPAIFMRALSLAATLVLVTASLAPNVPQLLYSFHLEHFAAFYVVTLLAAAARYRTRLRRLAIDILLLAAALELIRGFTPAHRLTSAEDFVADVGGMLAAMAPLVIARFRDLFSPTPPPAPVSDDEA